MKVNPKDFSEFNYFNVRAIDSNFDITIKKLYYLSNCDTHEFTLENIVFTCQSILVVVVVVVAVVVVVVVVVVKLTSTAWIAALLSYSSIFMYN